MSLQVMTFNLRYASATPPNEWPVRRPVMQACIRIANPDLIGTQEGLYAQLKDFAIDQPDYDWIGLGRDGGSRGEFMAVFYRRSRLEALEYDHFWLSDTPDVVGSSTWGNANRRMVTWVRFLDRTTGQQFTFWNTHFDHETLSARENAALLVAARVQALDIALPVILVGDFNDGRNSQAYATLTGVGGFTDTWDRAQTRVEPDYASFHGYQTPVPDGVHIDWILSRGDVVVEATQVVAFQQNGQYPSDHFPITATLRLGPA